MLADVQLGDCRTDLQAVADLALDASTVDAEVIAFVRRREVEGIGREFRFWDGRADDSTVRLVAEQDILEAEATPSAADVVVDDARLAFDPDALDGAVFIVVAIVGFECAVGIDVICIARIRLALEVEVPVVIDLELALEVEVKAAVVVAVSVSLDVVVIPADAAEARDLDAVELALDALAQTVQLLLLAVRLILELAVLVAELLDLFLQITLLLLERGDAAVDVLGLVSRGGEGRARQAHGKSKQKCCRLFLIHCRTSSFLQISILSS